MQQPIRPTLMTIPIYNDHPAMDIYFVRMAYKTGLIQTPAQAVHLEPVQARIVRYMLKVNL